MVQLVHTLLEVIVDLVLPLVIPNSSSLLTVLPVVALHQDPLQFIMVAMSLVVHRQAVTIVNGKDEEPADPTVDLQEI